VFAFKHSERSTTKVDTGFKINETLQQKYVSLKNETPVLKKIKHHNEFFLPASLKTEQK